jgi:SAM-dependent methyltransferase
MSPDNLIMGHATRPGSLTGQARLWRATTSCQDGRVRRPEVQAAAANRELYAQDEAAGYLRDPYHRLRLELAVRLLARYLRPSPGAPRPMVADLGAGGGQACTWLAGYGLCPIACDIVPDAQRAARDHRIVAVGLDISAGLPFRAGSLDGILAGEVIEHLFDPGRLLRECHRVLRPGGLLVVTTPNLATAQDRLRFLAGRAPRQVNPFHEYLYLHIRPFTPLLLAEGMRRAGLEPAKLVSNYVVWRTRFGEVRSRAAARLWPSLGGSLILAARRPAEEPPRNPD